MTVATVLGCISQVVTMTSLPEQARSVTKLTGGIAVVMKENY